MDVAQSLTHDILPIRAHEQELLYFLDHVIKQCNHVRHFECNHMKLRHFVALIKDAIGEAVPLPNCLFYICITNLILSWFLYIHPYCIKHMHEHTIKA